jgi:hypothetical protein
MRKLLGVLAATLPVALAIATSPATVATAHGGSQGCATKQSCAASGLGTALGGVGFESDGRYDIGYPVNDTNSVTPATVSTQDAPQFGFDVSVRTARDQMSGGWHDAGDHASDRGVIATPALSPSGERRR